MIVRVSKTTGNYSIIHNHPLSDPRLSLKAKGLASYLLTKPDTWKITVANIELYNQDQEDAILSALLELESAGYLKRRKYNNPATGYIEWERTLYESPQGDKLIEMQVALDRAKAGKRPLPTRKQKRKKQPYRDKPGLDKPGLDKPGLDKPGLDKPGLDKQGLVITDQVSTELVSTEEETTESEITEGRDDDDECSPQPDLVKEEIEVTRVIRVREALTNEIGQWHYNTDFIYALGIHDDELRTIMRTAALRALESAEIADDWTDLSSYLSELTARQCQRLMLWCYKLRFDDEWAIKIGDPIGFIQAKIDSAATFRPWQRGRLAWFICYCLTGQYESFEDLQQTALNIEY